ncbi:hypothetical protein DUI87_00533 [Hirundo rustica rustica]|uniref:Uncharacterized protein n=1 Tax=Hirundo rustica rustica TaxID=333673 RepID=A0A3M0L9E3_HIRRU|nr:hypothetical protein DUI87_00533 [Hirundo rustica rustica]
MFGSLGWQHMLLHQVQPPIHQHPKCSPSVYPQRGLILGTALIQDLVLLNLMRFPGATSGACPDLSGYPHPSCVSTAPLVWCVECPALAVSHEDITPSGKLNLKRKTQDRERSHSSFFQGSDTQHTHKKRNYTMNFSKQVMVQVRTRDIAELSHFLRSLSFLYRSIEPVGCEKAY